jgi:hypothetical protein
MTVLIAKRSMALRLEIQLRRDNTTRTPLNVGRLVRRPDVQEREVVICLIRNQEGWSVRTRPRIEAGMVRTASQPANSFYDNYRFRWAFL